ncbi:hypothetical protein BCY86_01995 [Pajaroellobacter abortibovis]|uniref:Uncharacterized protein n=2 Tax=Pajaroellobacter abortibovis TaxID=1882918 RepID=A0A1L6MVZ2_9BACT|nr:hypothetical protein BCY86_01995 [Pajaroellobacter abortibovis]
MSMITKPTVRYILGAFFLSSASMLVACGDSKDSKPATSQEGGSEAGSKQEGGSDSGSEAEAPLMGECAKHEDCGGAICDSATKKCKVIMFVSKNKYKATQVATACTEELKGAAAALQNFNFVPVVSKSDKDVKTIFASLKGPVVLPDATGTQVASSATAMLSAGTTPLARAVSIGADGKSVSEVSNVGVMTGTKADGTMATDTAKNWTDDNAKVQYGMANATNGDWLFKGTIVTVSSPQLVYCVSSGNMGNKN